MQSRSRIPEEPPGSPCPRPLVTVGDGAIELAAIALLCKVFAWPAEERDQLSPRPDSQ